MVFRNKSVSAHSFAMVPSADIPRSSYTMEKADKFTFDGGYLVPCMCEEVLPGDTWRVDYTSFCRMSTPIFPVMDNLKLDIFFFYCPNRLVWSNWEPFMGEKEPEDIDEDFLIPQVNMPGGNGQLGWPVGSIADYFGIPTEGQMDTPGAGARVNALPFRMYNLIFNDWFRDENLQDSLTVALTDGPDAPSLYVLQRRGKRHDYFTSCLPWPQKSLIAPSIAIAGTAPVSIERDSSNPGVSDVPNFSFVGGGGAGNLVVGPDPATAVNTGNSSGLGAGTNIGWGTQVGLVGEADLSAATAITINALRTSFQIQRLLERDARGGTRYAEIVRSHFGVVSPDARLQRPEYLGGGSVPISFNAVAQTSSTDTETPQGNLSAFAQTVQRNGFSQSFTEHGYIIGLVNVRADLTYQQGLRRHWSRRTKHDFYWPAFAHLGEQAVLQKEIFATGDAGEDSVVFGYQERWAEYRYLPSEIKGLFRSYETGTIDPWHLSQEFATAPQLNAEFIVDEPPVERILAVGEEALGQQFLMDQFIRAKVARPLPLYSVPGLIDHF